MTSATRIRVPLNVGWPWQMAGSVMMCRPIVRFVRLVLLAVRHGDYLKHNYGQIA